MIKEKTKNSIVVGVDVLMNILNAVLRLVGNRKIYDPENPPDMPGSVLEKFLMPRFELDEKKLSDKSGLSESELKNIFNGSAKISPEIVWKLRPALAGAADQLYYLQRAYDYYSDHQMWPPSPSPATVREIQELLKEKPGPRLH